MVPSNRSIAVARLAWLLLAALALLVQLANLYLAGSSLPTDWQAAATYPVLRGALDFHQYSLLIIGLRSLVAFIFWLSALVLYFEVGRRSSPEAGMGLFTSVLLLLIPPTLILASNSSAVDLPQNWWTILTTLGALVFALCLPMLVLFYFLFPDGVVQPRWMRWSLWVYALLLSILFASLAFSWIPGDWVWPAAILGLGVGLLLGLASQIYRYVRRATPLQRRQTLPVIGALSLLFAILLVSSSGAGSSLGSLINLLLQTLGLAALPLALMYAYYRRGLWRLEAQAAAPFLRRPYVLAALGLVVLWAAILAQAYPRQPAIAFEPLPASPQPRPVIIDTDMAPDDWMAILYLLQRPDIDVQAITVTGTGETHCEPGVRNALRLVALAGESGIPAACGRETPLQGHHVFPDEWRVRADEMNGIPLPEPDSSLIKPSAVALLVDTVSASPQPVTLLALGPLTNLAELVQSHPSVLKNIVQIYVMGGALEVLGNVASSTPSLDNQVAEWNIYVDPLAARILFESGAPVTLVPLDATSQVPVTLEFYNKLVANRRTPEAQLVYDLLTSQLDFVASGGYSFWDPLVAAILADESLGYIKEGQVMVITQEGPSSGLTRLNPKGSLMRYAKSADRELFELEFLRALNQP